MFFGGQIIMVEWFGSITKTVSLTRSEWGGCIMTGASVLVVAWLLKFTPKALLKKIPFTKFVDEDKQTNDKFAQMALAMNENKIDMPNVNIGGKSKGDDYQALDNETSDNFRRQNS